MRIALRPVVILAAFAATFGAAPAAAQAQNENARQLASNYQLSDALGERRCAVTLEARTSGAGHALVMDRSVCGPLFAHLANVTAWVPAPAGGIRFIDAKGAAITEFSEGVGGVYEAIRDNDGVYFLTNLKIADTSETESADLVGDWNLSRPGGPAICRITLTNQVTPEKRFALKVAPNCDSAIAAFGPSSWQLSTGDVLLFSEQGEQIRLGKNEEGIWARVPDQKQSRPRPLLMMRP